MAELNVPVAVPDIGEAEKRYVTEALETGWVSTAGPLISRFEEAVADAMGAKHGIGTATGTAALHVALIVAGVQPDDEVLVSAYTFIAPANAIRYTGAWPVFVDPEPVYWQMDPALVRAFLAEHCERDADGVLRNRTSGRRVSAIVPVDVLGHPVQIEALLSIAAEYGLAVVEDNAESLGAEYRTQAGDWVPVGSLAPVAATSFNGNKTITAGGGGMIVTSDAALAEHARYLSTTARDPGLEFVHQEVGFNYRLSNLHAAVGLAQMERMDELVGSKRAIAERYGEGLAGVPGLTLMAEAEWARGTWWLYTVVVDEREFGMDSRELIRRLAEDGIGSQPRWQALYDSPAYAGAERVGPGVAADLHARSVSLPCSFSLTNDQQDRVIELIRGYGRRT